MRLQQELEAVWNLYSERNLGFFVTEMPGKAVLRGLFLVIYAFYA